MEPSNEQHSIPIAIHWNSDTQSWSVTTAPPPPLQPNSNTLNDDLLGKLKEKDDIILEKEREITKLNLELRNNVRNEEFFWKIIQEKEKETNRVILELGKNSNNEELRKAIQEKDSEIARLCLELSNLNNKNNNSEELWKVIQEKDSEIARLNLELGKCAKIPEGDKGVAVSNLFADPDSTYNPRGGSAALTGSGGDRLTAFWELLNKALEGLEGEERDRARREFHEKHWPTLGNNEDVTKKLNKALIYFENFAKSINKNAWIKFSSGRIRIDDDALACYLQHLLQPNEKTGKIYKVCTIQTKLYYLRAAMKKRGMKGLSKQHITSTGKSVFPLVPSNLRPSFSQKGINCDTRQGEASKSIIATSICDFSVSYEPFFRLVAALFYQDFPQVSRYSTVPKSTLCAPQKRQVWPD